jgi:hypothetical protein
MQICIPAVHRMYHHKGGQDLWRSCRLVWCQAGRSLQAEPFDRSTVRRSSPWARLATASRTASLGRGRLLRGVGSSGMPKVTNWPAGGSWLDACGAPHARTRPTLWMVRPSRCGGWPNPRRAVDVPHSREGCPVSSPRSYPEKDGARSRVGDSPPRRGASRERLEQSATQAAAVVSSAMMSSATSNSSSATGTP